MARGNAPLHTFNRGRISRLGLARTDLDRVRLSADIMVNWIPRTLGSMMLRPGLQYIGGTQSNAQCRLIPFVFKSTDTALVEVSSGTVRVWSSDVVIARVASTAAVTLGTFSSTLLGGWTDADEAGTTSEWVSGDYMSLTGTRYARAKRRQTITAASGNHGLAISVNRGRPILRIGSSVGGDDYFEETELKPGNYSLKIASTGNFDIEFSANTEYGSRIESVAVESSGDMTITAPWTASDLGKLRWDQSGDVIFVAGSTNKQRRIERHAQESWAVVEYDPQDGPFRTINVTQKRLTPSALSGSITLTCDQPLFKSGHAGALFEVTSVGQQVEGTFTGADQWTNSIRVSGVTDTRIFDILVSSLGTTGSTDITVRVQRSVGEEGSWANVSGLSWTSTIATSHDDGLDNQIVFYRIGVGTTDYGSTSSGTAAASLTYAAGGITGITRITSVVAATESSAIVLENLGSTGASELWSEGSWSDYRGWPTSVSFFEGRLVFAGKSRIWASVTDAYDSHDADVSGDSGPINRTITGGPIDTVEWLVPLNRLVVGTQSAEFQAKTSSLEEPLTPTNFSLRDVSTQGSASVSAVKVDQRMMFVQAGGSRIMEVGPNESGLDQVTIDRTVIIPEIGEPSISRIAVQRQPDTRFHCVRSDGTVAMLLSDPAEDVLCWLDVTSTAETGSVEEVAVLPGTVEDKVYYVVKREINGSTVRYLEKWGLESEARGGSTNKIGDSFIVVNTTKTDSVTGVNHLFGSSVVVWGATADLGSYTVSTSGTLTASACSTFFCVGLPYDAYWKSAKLAYAAQAGTALLQKKKIDRLGLILADVHAQGVLAGRSTTAVDHLPLIYKGQTLTTDTVSAEREVEMTAFGGSWDTDSRLVLKASAPRPVTVLGAVINIDTKEKG